MKPIKLKYKPKELLQNREIAARSHSNKLSIELSTIIHKKIDGTKKHYSYVHLVNTLNKDIERMSELLRYYADNLRLCPNVKHITFSQIILTDQNLKSLIKLIRPLKRLEAVTLDIKQIESLRLPLVKRFYQTVSRMKQIKSIRVFTSTFYRYNPNINRPLFFKPELQSRFETLELTITRELVENQKEEFLTKLQKFKKLQSLSLDFSRASVANALPYLFGGFSQFAFLKSLTLNLDGQYVNTDAYKNLASSLSNGNLENLSLALKCSSTIGLDLSMVLQTVARKLSYLKLLFMDEGNLTPETMDPFAYSFQTLTQLREFHLDVSKSAYCNLLLAKIGQAFSKKAKIQKLSLKYNSNENLYKTKGVTLKNIRDILIGNPDLKDVSLHCSNSQGIKDVKDGVASLVQGIRELRDLEYFNIFFHFCFLNDYSVKDLLRTLSEKKQMKGISIAIDSFRISDNGLWEIGNSLKNLRSLEELKLKMIKWKISEKGLDYLCFAISKAKKLFNVNMAFQDVGTEEQAQEFEFKLKKGFPRHRVSVEYRR